MARSRNIKPGFFTNEVLMELDPLTRLLFIGLWTIADRLGRLEDRPKRIKVQLLSGDRCDVDAMLQALHDSGFIERYTVDGNRFIQVSNFGKHQNPHRDEKRSTIPAPCLHDASTIPAPEMHSSSRADSFNLDPDSFNLDPDSLNHDASTIPAPCLHDASTIQEGETRNGPPERDGGYDLGETKTSPINRVMAGIEQVYGHTYAAWETQRGTIGTLLDIGYTVEEIVGTWYALWVNDNKSRFPPLNWVADRIQGYRTNGGKLPLKEVNSSGVHKNYPGPPSDADPREYYRSSYELLERRERIRQQEEQQQAEKKGTTTGDS